MVAPLSRTDVRSLLAALLAACIAFQLNASMVSPALVVMADHFRTTTATTGLTQTAFFASAGLFSAFVPRLSDIKGRRKTLVVVLAVTTAGEVLSALAPTIGVLFVARIMAGFCGPVIAICLLMLRAAVPDPRRYSTLMGVVIAVNGGVAGLDALVGGFLAGQLGFRSVFWTMAAVAALATSLAVVWAPETKPSAATRMDWLGALPLAVATISLLLAAGELGNPGDVHWGLVTGLALLALAAGAAFFAVERSVRSPLIRPQHLRQRGTWALLVTTTLTLCGIFATVNGVVLDFAQDPLRGYGLDAGMASLLFLTPYALVGWAVGPFAGRLAPAVGYLRLLRIGLGGSIVAMALMATAGVKYPLVLAAAMILLGVTYAGIANILLSGLSVVLSPSENPGFLPGVNSSAFNLGAALSFAVLPAVQVVGSPVGSHTTAGYTSAMLLGLAITAAALSTSYLIPRPVSAEDPASGERAPESRRAATS